MIKLSEKIITKYRDKFLVERHNILIEYAEKTKEQGTMYFIYDKNTKNDLIYNATICEKGKSHQVIQLNKNELPKEAEINTVLRKSQNGYDFDKTATEKIKNELDKLLNKLLKEQEKELQQKRIEGHIYEFVEKSQNIVTLIDITKNDGRCFEDTEFPKEYLEKAKEGEKYQFINGKYKPYK